MGFYKIISVVSTCVKADSKEDAIAKMQEGDIITSNEQMESIDEIDVCQVTKAVLEI